MNTTSPTDEGFLSSALSAFQVGLSMITTSRGIPTAEKASPALHESNPAEPAQTLPASGGTAGISWHALALLTCPMCGRPGFNSPDDVAVHITFEHFTDEAVEEEPPPVELKPILPETILYIVVPYCGYETIQHMAIVPIKAAQVWLDYIYDSAFCYKLWEYGQVFEDDDPWRQDSCVGTWVQSQCHHFSREVEQSLPPDTDCRHQWKRDLFTDICGPQRGLYCFLRHVANMSAEDILNMTTREVLTKMTTMDGVRIDMHTMMAAQFYGLNNLACVIFEAMDLSAEQFVSEWNNLLMNGNRYFTETSSCAHLWANVFGMIDGRDPLASLFIHGNKYLVRQISARYGDANGVVWCDGVSIFTRSMPLALDTLSLNQDWARLARNWRFHLCNHRRGALELCHIFVRATNPWSFHMWYQIYLMTGSTYALNRVRERTDADFGVNHLRLLSRHVLNRAKLRDFLSLGGQCGFLRDSDLGRQFIAVAEKYPFENGCCTSEKYHYTDIGRYLTPAYMELHSFMHTLVFRV